MNERFQQRMKTVIAKFDELKKMQPLKRDFLPHVAADSGVYLFSDGTVHYYVGRSRDVRERILQHSRPSVLDAPFAFRRAREILKLPATYPR
jgi:excinuclease UvrABC nuclease subunit